MKSACWIALAAACSTLSAFAVELARYPYIQNLRADRVTVIWTTRQPGGGAVRYSAEGQPARIVPARIRELTPAETGYASSHWEHRAELTGLGGSTQYAYRVLVDGQDLTPKAAAEELRFRTAGPGPFGFLAFGDSGEGGPDQRTLATLMSREPGISVLVHSGDVAYPSGSFAEFERNHFAVYVDMFPRIPFFPCPGNHDYYTADAAPYISMHAVPTDGVPGPGQGRYYSFNWGNVHFVSLDTNRPFADALSGRGEMLDWLDRDLARSPSFWNIVYLHHPPYPTGFHVADPVAAQVRQAIVPIVERYRVPLVISGHEHNFQRRKPSLGGGVLGEGVGTIGVGTTYIITGGGGAGLYGAPPRPELAARREAYHYLRFDVQGAKILMKAVAIEGTVIDTVTLAPVPIVPPDGVVNAASYTPAVAPGSLITIFGQFLAAEEAQARSLPLPRELADTRVVLGARELPIFYAGPNQVNAQLPFDALGPARLRVFSSNGQAEVNLDISATAPAIFNTAHADYSLVSPASPARPGETLVVYMTGLGAVNGEIREGDAAPFSPPLTVRAPIAVQIGGFRVAPEFAGLAPGFVGLYQVNVTVPQKIGSGSFDLRFDVSGRASNIVRVPVLAAPEPQQDALRRAERPSGAPSRRPRNARRPSPVPGSRRSG